VAVRYVGQPIRTRSAEPGWANAPLRGSSWLVERAKSWSGQEGGGREAGITRPGHERRARRAGGGARRLPQRITETLRAHQPNHATNTETSWLALWWFMLSGSVRPCAPGRDSESSCSPALSVQARCYSWWPGARPYKLKPTPAPASTVSVSSKPAFLDGTSVQKKTWASRGAGPPSSSTGVARTRDTAAQHPKMRSSPVVAARSAAMGACLFLKGRTIRRRPTQADTTPHRVNPERTEPGSHAWTRGVAARVRGHQRWSASASPGPAPKRAASAASSADARRASHRGAPAPTASLPSSPGPRSPYTSCRRASGRASRFSA
jgi:hypothetical protein